ncbi:MFS transporter [Aestuariirhabdus litorea]|uniref:MFS transporter n=1 Tax=Aestuariirhabdus litorea TaxID=2528527 RepID=A0A3P3VK63_9GAMM|nr:MFS transporter [Aestuariirhabdus litorea]RRJ82278.1 MFS transporter [Aestuariirhabdus litorea]RWW92444.1 MFS transporter [Endozoicomonadaceae bacterium GTF-13]
MRLTLLPLASLLVSCFIMMLGNGLINILLPVRMDLESMGTDTIGLVLSLYFVGMLAGGLYARQLIRRAGHIRMFAGCLAIAAVSVLLCSLYTDAALWGAMRVVIGFCNACAYCAMESWLNESASKSNRGRVLAFYQVVMLVGLFMGQFLLNLAAPTETTLFVLGGILLTASVIPVVLSRQSGPALAEVATMSLKTLYQRSPLGVVSCFMAGVVYSALFNMLPLFARYYGITDSRLPLYMGAAIMGGFLLQFPVGYLTDRFDRRSVLLVVLLISCISGLSVTGLASAGQFWLTCAATAVTAGIISCFYPISIAEAFDKLRTNEMVAAMGCLILAFSLGGILGPYAASLVMGVAGYGALFVFLAVGQLLLAAFVVYRMRARKALPVEEQEQVSVHTGAAPMMPDRDPRTDFIESPGELSEEARIASEVAETDPGAAIKLARAVAMAGSEHSAEITTAVASVEQIDPLRFYQVLLDAVPEQALEITIAIVRAQPNRAYALVSRLAREMPERVVEIAAEIGREMPDLRLEMARVAIESAPESAIAVAEYYARVLAEEHQSVRPADREDDNSEQSAAELVSEISELAPEQAAEVAATFAEAMPEVAEVLAEELDNTPAGR